MSQRTPKITSPRAQKTNNRVAAIPTPTFVASQFVRASPVSPWHVLACEAIALMTQISMRTLNARMNQVKTRQRGNRKR